MEQVLFQLSFDRLSAILLALVPAILNLLILVYVVVKLPLNRITKIFSAFILAIFCWQLTDVMARASLNSVTANSWESLLSPGWMMMAPLGLHFALLNSGRRKFTTSVLGFSLLYMPAFILTSLYLLNDHLNVFAFNSYWGWVSQLEETTIGLIIMVWIIALLLLTFYFFAETASKVWNIKLLRIQAIMILIGYTIPLIIGVLTEALFPVVFKWEALPLSSTMMLFFSIATVVALKKYKLFHVNEYVNTEDIVEKVPDIIITISTDHLVTYINPYGQKTLGINLEVPFPVDDLFMGDLIARERFLNRLMVPALNGMEADNYLLHIKPLGEDELQLLSSIKPLISNGVISSVLLVARDVSEKYKAEQQLQEKNLQLQKANLELDKFVYSTSHDIRGPLMSMLGIVNLLEEEQDDRVQGRYFNLLRQSIERLDDVTREINEYSNNNRLSLKIEQLDLTGIVGSIIAEVKYLRETENVQLRLNINESIPFYSDADRVKLVIKNVILNSIKYADKFKENKWAKISINTTSDEAVIVIEDNGEGINAIHRDQIFNMFTRFSSSSKGAGLGLYIVKEVLQKLQGTIEVKSTLGTGSIFKIHLPNKCLTFNKKPLSTVVKA